MARGGGDVGSPLTNIQRITRDVKREGVYHFREQPEVVSRFRTIRTSAESRDGIQKQGEFARQVWAKADDQWFYEPNQTVAVFGSLLAASYAQGVVYNGTREDWRKAAAKLRATAMKLHQEGVAWYAAATSKFKKGTEEGDTIRSVVPTTYTPPPPVGQAMISNVIVSGGTIHWDCTALHATKFTYLHMPPGSPVFVVLFADSPLKSVTLFNQIVGLHRIQAIPRNSGGEGEASAVVEITVAAQAAA